MESKKVLIAEDSSVIQNLTKKILQIQNYQIFSAKNGVQVLEMLENEFYDVILMDINMPKMDGMECAAKIRALDDDKKSKKFSLGLVLVVLGKQLAEKGIFGLGMIVETDI